MGGAQVSLNWWFWIGGLSRWFVQVSRRNVSSNRGPSRVDSDQSLPAHVSKLKDLQPHADFLGIEVGAQLLLVHQLQPVLASKNNLACCVIDCFAKFACSCWLASEYWRFLLEWDPKMASVFLSVVLSPKRVPTPNKTRHPLLGVIHISPIFCWNARLRC